MKWKLPLIMLIFLTAVPAQAIRFFDGNRRGFMLQESFGMGATTVFYKDLTGSTQITKGAFCIELKIGYGAHEQFQLYLINKIAIIDYSKMIDDYENYFDKMSEGGISGAFFIIVSPFVLPFIPYASSHSLIGFGADYYFSKGAPSYFIGAGFGGSFMYNPIIDEVDDGISLFISGGYELQGHALIKFDIMYGFPGKQEEDDYYYPLPEPEEKPSTKALSFLLSFGFHQY